mmetsp:Transcript_16564/g.21954  ORF Transcript_16564/g.21954 Transcript_16564/m.21954 type:complete len:95 (+) Transcript_16564:1742-2026(+)
MNRVQVYFLQQPFLGSFSQNKHEDSYRSVSGKGIDLRKMEQFRKHNAQKETNITLAPYDTFKVDRKGQKRQRTHFSNLTLHTTMPFHQHLLYEN